MKGNHANLKKTVALGKEIFNIRHSTGCHKTECPSLKT